LCQPGWLNVGSDIHRTYFRRMRWLRRCSQEVSAVSRRSFTYPATYTRFLKSFIFYTFLPMLESPVRKTDGTFFHKIRKYMILPRLQTNRPVSWPRIKAEVLWRLRDRALLMRASERPRRFLPCLRRLAVRPRQASNRSGDSAPKRHESITHGWRLRTGRFLPGFSYNAAGESRRGLRSCSVAMKNAIK
jgi:hypothetical protein